MVLSLDACSFSFNDLYLRAGKLDVVSVQLSQSGLRPTLQTLLNTFKLPLTPLSKMKDSPGSVLPDRQINYYGHMRQDWDYAEPARKPKL